LTSESEKMKKLIVTLCFLFFVVDFVSADVSLPQIFGDNMVLQTGMRLPVWGRAEAGEKVSVEFKDFYVETVADSKGRWKVFIGPLETGGPFEFKVEGENSILLKNVMVGEVWVCSGQSNMAMEVRNSLNAEAEIAAANYPQIRLFQINRAKAAAPLKDVSPVDGDGSSRLNKWQVCSPETVGNFTGVGFFFARELREKLDIPVGIISASWGGTTVEAWTPADTLANDPELNNVLQNWPDYNNDEEWLREVYAEFVVEVNKAREDGKAEPLYFNQPSVLYNGIMAPVIPYGIKGVTWYQGESNAYRAHQYKKLFPAMIQQWRKNWGQGDFPFLFVQLANYHFEPQVFPELREAQAKTLSIPETAMAVAIDLGESTDIHPKNKQEVGRRLSLAARKMAYGEEIIYSGPLYKSMSISAGKCRLRFDHVGDGLTIKGKEPLSGFVIAGKDKKFVKAQAVIENDEIIVWSPDVPDPVAVRYAWANDPKNANLYNKCGDSVHLPASPFRTDDWPGITFNRK